ncbi:MAG: PotD/PotF family extracellular solute-binding protein [Lachnospiraceae bacterium]
MKKWKKILGMALLGSMVMALAGCGGSSESDSSKEDADGNGYADKVYLFTWSEYMTQEVKDAFYDEYGIEVVETNFETNEEMMAKLTAGDATDYDIIVPTNTFVEALKENDLIEPLDEGAITNIKYLNEGYLDASYDPGNEYTIPYMGTASLVVGNKKMLDELGVTIDDWEDLTDPKLKDNLVIMDDNSGYTCLAYSCMGLDPEFKDLEGLKKAEDYLLEKISPNVKAWCGNNEAKNMLIRSEVAVGFIFSGDAAMVLQENPDCELLLLDKKTDLTMDVWALVKGCKHKKEAELFIDFCTRPEIAAKLTEEYPYISPNDGAKEYISDDIKNNPACFLPDEFFEDYYMMDTIPSEIAAKNDEIGTVIKSSK